MICSSSWQTSRVSRSPARPPASPHWCPLPHGTTRATCSPSSTAPIRRPWLNFYPNHWPLSMTIRVRWPSSGPTGNPAPTTSMRSLTPTDSSTRSASSSSAAPTRARRTVAVSISGSTRTTRCCAAMCRATQRSWATSGSPGQSPWAGPDLVSNLAAASALPAQPTDVDLSKLNSRSLATATTPDS